MGRIFWLTIYTLLTLALIQLAYFLYQFHDPLINFIGLVIGIPATGIWLSILICMLYEKHNH